MSKHSKIIDKIQENKLSRDKIETMLKNARLALDKGDNQAETVVNAIISAAPKDKYYIFMGFCPGADFGRRQDIRWRQESICDFFFYDSEHQMKRFRKILPGDLIILKKIEQFGVTMKLYGYGRVERITDSKSGDRILKMKWSVQDQTLEVPLIACNETVNIKKPSQLDGIMPEKFWDWLKI